MFARNVISAPDVGNIELPLVFSTAVGYTVARHLEDLDWQSQLGSMARDAETLEKCLNTTDDCNRWKVCTFDRHL